jgi:hypothetical protein
MVVLYVWVDIFDTKQQHNTRARGFTPMRWRWPTLDRDGRGRSLTPHRAANGV